MEHIILYHKRRKGIRTVSVYNSAFRKLICFFVFAAILSFSSLAYGNSDAQDQLDFANGLFARKMHSMAISEYEKFIALHPEHPKASKAYFMIGESFFHLGEYVKAKEKYEEYLRKFSQGPEVLRVRINSVICDMELKDFAKAKVETSELLKSELSPGEKSEVLFLSGLANLGGNREEGRKNFEQAIEASENRYAAAAAYQLGLLYYADKEYKKAIPFFKKAVDLTDDNEVKQLSLLGLSQLEFELGEHEQALKRFNQLMADEKTSTEIKSKASVGVLSVLTALGRYSEAIALYNDKKELFSSARLKFEATMLAVQAYSKEGKYQEALVDIEPLLNNEALTQKEHDMVLLDKVNALLLTQRISEAKSILDSRDSNADMPRYLFFKAEACYLMGEYLEAKKYYETVLSEYPDSAQGQDAAYGIAHAMLKNGQQQEARDAFVKFFEMYPDDKRSPNTLYSALLLDKELGLLKEGIRDAKLFVEHYADDTSARNVWFMLGHFYTDSKNVKPAIQAYQEYIRLYPGDERINEVYYLLAYNLQVSGALEESNAYYGKVSREQSSDLYYSAQKNIVQNNISGGNEQGAAQVLFSLMKDFPENDINIDTYLWTAKKFIDSVKYDITLEALLMARKKKEQADRKIDLAYYMGETQRRLGDYEESIKEYKDCIALDKKRGEFTGPALIGIGLSLQGKGEIKEAIQSFEKAIEFNPEDNAVTMNARYYTAELLLQQERFDEAGRMFMMVAILYDDDRFVADALYEAAVVFHKAGMKEQSKEACADLKKKFPSSEKIAILKKMLEEE